MCEYFEQKKIFFVDQFGFRAGRTTSQSCVGLLQHLYDNLDQGNLVVSIFLDFCKAFDSVNHNILMDKLRFYGLRGFIHDWFQSYLCNRTQFVNINNISS